ncbi:MAG: DNA lyase, partial [Burkholderiales bacterium]|nr:DNA lyase [Burkholderiales bacterium]
AQEADRRNYQFNHTKIIDLVFKDKIPVTNGQVQYEFKHLLNKLKNRDRALYDKFENMTEIDRHPLFYGVSGDVEDWEIM